MNILKDTLERKFNALLLRERLLTFTAMIFLIYWIWSSILYGYVLATDEEIAKKAEEIKSQISLLEGQIDNISEVVGRDPTAVLLQQAAVLKKENAALGKKIYEGSKKMVSSKDMTIVVKNLIEETEDLVLTNMESLGSKPLFTSKSFQENNKVVNFQAFNHGLKVELLGGYFETMKFLKAVEAENANVMWDELNYEVIKYPKAKIIIYLHTLGLQEGWIGV